MPDISLDSASPRITISLPDMFRGFLVGDPVVNSHYGPIRLESEGWLQSTMGLPMKQVRRVHACDFSYFCSVLIPHASRDKLRIVSDWGNWVFLFDDMFDEGELTNDPNASRRIINNLLSVMVQDVDRSSEEPVVIAHDSIYSRFAAGSRPSTVKRYVQHMQSYCAGVLQHVNDYAADRIPTVLEMIETRRMSIGAFPMYPLIEFAYNLDIPDEVFLHPVIQTLENLGAEFVMLMNDILSYQKEESENCPFNTVAVCRMAGASAQKAFDEVAFLVHARFDQWDEAVKSLPSWGEDIDSQVQQYIQGLQNIVQANLSWSFRTGRYFGSKADLVRQSRELDVLMRPPFLGYGVPPQPEATY